MKSVLIVHKIPKKISKKILESKETKIKERDERNYFKFAQLVLSQFDGMDDDTLENLYP